MEDDAEDALLAAVALAEAVRVRVPFFASGPDEEACFQATSACQ